MFRKSLFTLTLIANMLLFITLTTSVYAKTEETGYKDIDLLFKEEKVSVYSDLYFEETIGEIDNDTEILILEIYDEYILIMYQDIEDDEFVEGYIRKLDIIIKEENEIQEETEDMDEVTSSEEENNSFDSIELKEEENDNELSLEKSEVTTNKDGSVASTSFQLMSDISFNGIALKSNTNVYSNPNIDSKVLKSYEVGSILKYNTYNNNWYQAIVYIGGLKSVGYIHRSDVENLLLSSERYTLRGIASNNKTHVYKSANTNSTILKSYNQGSILKYSTFSKNWYEAIIYINGVKTKGYIHKNQVENTESNLKSLEGIAINTTHIYNSASTTSKRLKSYPSGSVLKYTTFSKDWYEAVVYINGIRTNGYIHKEHVENAQVDRKALRGIAKQNNVNVYSSASTESNVLKKYPKGSVLKYTTFSKNWYVATIYINGEKNVGYINKSHVDTGTEHPTEAFGVSLKDNTYIYQGAIKKSNEIIKNYNSGSLLKYRTFTRDWYEVTVYVNGKRKTGYLHKNDVGTPDIQTGLRGIGLMQPTSVYSTPFDSSPIIKKYEKGSILKYKTFTKDWYEALVYVEGKAIKGYIKVSETEDALLTEEQQIIENAKAINNSTKVYAKASRSAKVLKTYKAGSILKFKTFSENWYEATVSIDGKYVTGYIHESDISSSSVRTIIIDAGHGGVDSGALGSGLQEKDIALNIALKVKQLLGKDKFNVVMTREDDEYLSLSDRTDLANKSNADALVSIHVNSGGGTGIETWKMEKGPSSKESNILADEIQNEVINRTKETNRGVKDGNLHINRESNMPSSLIEVGFIDNEKDADKLRKESHLNKIANGIVAGIKSFFDKIF